MHNEARPSIGSQDNGAQKRFQISLKVNKKYFLRKVDHIGYDLLM